jgi:ADP-ribosyl-[dinitrogen reductase] hydrolase
MLLVDIAVGDAYGAGFEFRPADFVRKHNDARTYRAHALGPHGPGEYTDDTQMSIAVAELVLENRNSPWALTQEKVAEAFIRVFQRDPRETYAKHFFEFMKTVTSAEDLLTRIKSDSRRSGAAMRALPAGVYDSVEKVMWFSHLQASVTHNTKEGRDSAAAAALMYHYIWWNLGPKAELPEFLDAHVPGYDWGKPWEGFCPSDGIPCVKAAVTVVTQQSSAEGLLLASVDFTGDTDTIASLAYGAGMASREVGGRSVTKPLEDSLERGPYGWHVLYRLSQKLAVPVRKWKPSSAADFIERC